MKSKTIKKQIFEYVAVFEPDEKASGYSVSIPALPGCISEGDNFEEAIANIREAAQLYLEVLSKKKKQDFFKFTIKICAKEHSKILFNKVA